jgi:hypothetical protein
VRGRRCAGPAQAIQNARLRPDYALALGVRSCSKLTLPNRSEAAIASKAAAVMEMRIMGAGYRFRSVESESPCQSPPPWAPFEQAARRGTADMVKPARAAGVEIA